MTKSQQASATQTISKKRRGKQALIIPSRFNEKAEKGMEDYMKAQNFKWELKNRKKTGSKNLKENTTDSYEKHYRGLYRFAAILGDYESMVVLHPRAPVKFCPSMKHKTVALYMRYKSLKKGSPLLDDHDHEVFNSFNERMVCRGDWKDPGNCDQFMSAVTRIHLARGQDGAYYDECPDCRQDYAKDSKSTGCRYHPGEYRIWRKGNPRRSEFVQNVYKQCKDELSDHVVKGSYQLLPEELMQMRALLLSSNKLDDLQLWVIILISIYLFLRHDEFHGIMVEDIRPEFSAVTPDKIVSICIRVKGKTDVIPQNLILWARDDYPALCPQKQEVMSRYWK